MNKPVFNTYHMLRKLSVLIPSKSLKPLIILKENSCSPLNIYFGVIHYIISIGLQVKEKIFLSWERIASLFPLGWLQLKRKNIAHVEIRSH